MKYPNIMVKLIGTDGNAFSILGQAKKAARQAGLDKKQIDEYLNEAMNGDYDHLLQTTMQYFNVI